MKKKVIVFFSTCNAVAFYSELLNYIDIPVLALHVWQYDEVFHIVSQFTCLTYSNLFWQGKQKQNQRTNTFFEFVNRSDGILLCTDVAARGLDIPAVDWIIQYDPSDDPKVWKCRNSAKSVNMKHFIGRQTL